MYGWGYCGGGPGAFSSWPRSPAGLRRAIKWLIIWPVVAMKTLGPIVGEHRIRMGGRTRERRRSHSAKIRRRKIAIASTALVVVIGLAIFAANGGVTGLFDVQGTDIPPVDEH